MPVVTSPVKVFTSVAYFKQGNLNKQEGNRPEKFILCSLLTQESYSMPNTNENLLELLTKI